MSERNDQYNAHSTEGAGTGSTTPAGSGPAMQPPATQQSSAAQQGWQAPGNLGRGLVAGIAR